MSDFGLSQLSLNDRVEVKVPRGAKGSIIGKGGSTIRSLQQKTGCKIFSPDRSCDFFVVTGAPENVEKAQAEISELVKTFKLNKRSRYSPRENNNLPETLGKKGIGLCHEWV